MATPESLNMEALQTMMRAWVDEISTKQTENLNAKLEEQTEKLNNKLEQQSENFNTKLGQQTENFKQRTIKITESSEALKIDKLQLKQDNIELKQSIVDSEAQLIKKMVNTNLLIETIKEDICAIIDKQTEQICETMLWEETRIIEDPKENTFVINNDNSREIINVKEERKVKIKQEYLIDRNVQVAGYTHSNNCLLYTSRCV